MAVITQDLTLHAGRDWIITLTAHDDAGSVIVLDPDTEIEFRINGIVDGNAVNLLTCTVGDGITVLSGESQAEITITIADQEAAGLAEGLILVYESRVTKDGQSYPQTEGRLFVERSLFATTVNPLLEEFQARFPEVLDNDTTILLFLGDAAQVVNANPVWRPQDRPLAILYLTAHMLLMRKKGASEYSSGGVSTGDVRSISVGDRTVSFGTGNSSNSKQGANTRTGFNQTTYGQEYLAMLRRNPVFLSRA
jgi:hypothetical protein